MIVNKNSKLTVEQQKRKQQLATLFKKVHRKIHDWERVGNMYGISAAMAWRIANEIEYLPKDETICKALGIPIYHPAPVCPHCLQVPLKKHCGCMDEHEAKTRKRIEIPADLSEEELQKIHNLTKEERARRLLQYE